MMLIAAERLLARGTACLRSLKSDDRFYPLPPTENEVCCCRSKRESKGLTEDTRIELPQGTLDLLILKIVALEPQHGWRFPSGFTRPRTTLSKSCRDLCIQLCTGWSAVAGFAPSGPLQKTTARPNTTRLPQPGANNRIVQHKMSLNEGFDSNTAGA
jgi:hypothetical protein